MLRLIPKSKATSLKRRVGRDGRVVYNPGIGPFGYNPDHLEREIQAYLAGGTRSPLAPPS